MSRISMFGLVGALSALDHLSGGMFRARGRNMPPIVLILRCHSIHVESIERSLGSGPFVVPACLRGVGGRLGGCPDRV
jgi:hypothetical protein